MSCVWSLVDYFTDALEKKRHFLFSIDNKEDNKLLCQHDFLRGIVFPEVPGNNTMFNQKEAKDFSIIHSHWKTNRKLIWSWCGYCVGKCVVGCVLMFVFIWEKRLVWFPSFLWLLITLDFIFMLRKSRDAWLALNRPENNTWIARGHTCSIILPSPQMNKKKMTHSKR